MEYLGVTIGKLIAAWLLLPDFQCKNLIFIDVLFTWMGPRTDRGCKRKKRDSSVQNVSPQLGRKIRQVLPTLLYVDAAGGK